MEAFHSCHTVPPRRLEHWRPCLDACSSVFKASERDCVNERISVGSTTGMIGSKCGFAHVAGLRNDT